MWIGLFLSVPLVSLVLFLLDWFRFDKRTKNNRENENIDKEKESETKFVAAIDFVLGTLLYQGRLIS